MGLIFQRRVGAAADAKELEYIIALHQTCMPHTRENATVSSLDVYRLLRSRYRINPKHFTRQDAASIVRDLGGGDTVEQSDLVPSDASKQASNKKSERTRPVKKFIDLLSPTSTKGADERMQHENKDTDENDKKQSESSPKWTGHFTFSSLFSPLSIGSDQDDVFSSNAQPDSQARSSAQPVGFDEATLDHQVERLHEGYEVDLSPKAEAVGDDDLEEVEEDIDGKNVPLDDDNDGHGESSKDLNKKGKNSKIQKKNQRDLETYLDLVQILSLLLIPTIANAATDFRNGEKQKQVLEEPKRRYPLRALEILVYKVHSFWVDMMHARYESVRPKKELLVRNWRHVTLKELSKNNDGEPPRVSEDLVRELLLKYGEVERAQNTALIREMVEAASSASGLLDDEAWMNALSAGLDEWQPGAEERNITSFFEDVFGTRCPRDVHVEDVMKQNCIVDCMEKDVAESSRLEIVSGIYDASRQDHDELAASDTKNANATRYCACCRKRQKHMFVNERFNIDMVTDAHASLWTVVMLWVFYIFTAITYLSLLLSIPTVRETCDLGEFACQVLDAVYNWLVAACLLSICGLLIVLPTSLGNSPFAGGPLGIFLSVGITALLTFLPYYSVKLSKRRWDNGDEPTYPEVEGTVDWEWYKPFELLTVGAGSALMGFYVLLGFCDCILYFVGKRIRLCQILCQSSNARAESRLKVAALRKTKKLLENAFELHGGSTEQVAPANARSVTASQSEESIMRNFILRGERFERCGGVLWTWYGILNGNLHSTEGVWYNTRLIIMQVAQVSVGILISVIMLLSVPRVAEEAEKAREELDANTPQWAVDLIPTQTMVYRSLYPASFTAIVVIVLLIGVYIPSATTTCLRYRCQDIPSLGSPYFNIYRAAVDSVYTNAANGVWGMLGSAGLYFILVGLTLFLFQWSFSQSFMIQLLGWGLGLGITVCLKMLLTMSCRAAQYRSYYRIRPKAATVSSLLLECWFIGLGGSVLIGRITQFLFAAAFWIGRIDVKFLSEDVNVAGYAFDYVPLNFVKDVLVHEAHRHPWIERLAQIYLMRLKTRSFCTRAGAVWRQLAVLALCPWLAKYRVFGEERLSNALLSFQRNRDEMKEDDEGFAERLDDRVGTFEGAIADFGAMKGAVPVPTLFAEKESSELRASF